jgi:hypothetical protein
LHCDGISRAQMGSVEERFTRPSTMEGLSRSLRRAGPVLWVVWVDLFSSPHQRISPGRHSDYLSLPRLSESKPCRCIPTGKPRCSGQAGAGLTADGTGPALIFPWEICDEILTPLEAWFPPYPRQQTRPPLAIPSPGRSLRPHQTVRIRLRPHQATGSAITAVALRLMGYRPDLDGHSAGPGRHS